MTHRPARTTRPQHRRAFTLVEMLIVIVLLGIAGAMVIPEMGSVGVLRVQGALRTIVSDITFAQSDAIAYQQPRALVFDPAGNTYSVVQVLGGTVDLANTMYDPEGPGGRYIANLSRPDFGGARISAASFNTTAAGAGIPSATTVLIFDELGTPVRAPTGNTASSGGTITVTSRQGTWVINVEAFTGRISVRQTAGD